MPLIVSQLIESNDRIDITDLKIQSYFRTKAKTKQCSRERRCCSV